MENRNSINAQNEIVISDLVKRFGDITAVNGLNLEIKKGELFGFLGPNGAGKTTTISILCGLLAPSRAPLITARMMSGRICPLSRKESGCAHRKPLCSSF